VFDPQISNLVDALHPRDLGVVIRLSAFGVGEQRNLNTIIAECERWEADKDVVAVCFGFARSRDDNSEWEDFFSSEAQPEIKTREQQAAYSLAILALESPSKDHWAERVINKLRRNRAARQPAQPRGPTA
jgi:hypothetical protein